jgi:hypothetical protein
MFKVGDLVKVKPDCEHINRGKNNPTSSNCDVLVGRVIMINNAKLSRYWYRVSFGKFENSYREDHLIHATKLGVLLNEVEDV